MTLIQDLKYALRGFRKTPGFTAVVVLSITLGIAANTTVFSLVNGLLLGALPVREPDRLVTFSAGRSMSYLDFVDYREQSKDVFEGVTALFPIIPSSIGGGGEPERIWGQAVSANFFDVSGAGLARGRGFVADEDKAVGSGPVVVLSDGLWKRRFGADPGVIGKPVVLNGAPYTVVGVARPGFSGIVRAIIPEFWVPLSMTEIMMPDIARENLRGERSHQWLLINARLKPGATKTQATAAVNVIKNRIDEVNKKDADERKRSITLETAGGLIGGADKFAVGLMSFLMVIVGLVLLIACANVANLLLARATERRREIGIRLAIGAGRGRLIRQLLTESVLLAALGAVGAFLLTWFAGQALSKFQLPLPLPIAFDFTTDWRVLSYTAAIALITGLIFGLAPALRATKPDIISTLKNEGSGMGALRKFGLRNALVVLQVALSLVLLAGAGLFLRSLQSASSIDLGFRPQGVLMMAVDPKAHNYSADRTRQFLGQLRERVATTPGVLSMSYLDVRPLSLGGVSDGLKAVGEKDAKTVSVNIFRVGSRFFETMGTPVLRGREFQAREDRPVVVINQTLAREMFGNQDPLGRQIRHKEEKSYEVVGLVKDAKSRTIGESPEPCAYYAIESEPEQAISFFGVSIVAKISGNAGGMSRAIREQILTLDPNLAVFDASTMEEHVNKALLIPKISATLLGVFGAIGLTLATVGLYGVMSYLVRSRTREIGIRMALGAERGKVLRLVAQQGLTISLVGLLIGLGIALAVSRFASTFLYGISAHDLVTFIGVPLVLLAVALVAVLVPARRASRIDPIQALRYE